MPHVHKDFAILRSKILQLESENVNKRVGIRTTIIFRPTEVHYNCSYPIITKALLDRHYNAKQPVEGSTCLFRKTNLKKVESSDNKLTSHKRTQESPEKLTGPLEAISPRHVLASPEQLIVLDDTPIAHVDSPQPGASNENANSGVDALVIKDFDDEYRYLAGSDSDEDEESELTKNLKKIRADFPAAPTSTTTAQPQQHKQPQQQQQHKQQQHKQQQQQDKRQAPRPPARLATPQASPTPQQHEQQPVIQKEQPEPDWKEMIRQVSDGDFDKYLLVYQQLSRLEQKTNEDARKLLKEVTLRCFAKDESFHLLDFLELVFNHGFETDTTFICELLRRLKRKINPHTTVHTFKGKVDSEVVIKNYRLAQKKLANFVVIKDMEGLPLRVREIIELYNIAQIPNKILPIKKEEKSSPTSAMGSANEATISAQQVPLAQVHTYDTNINASPRLTNGQSAASNTPNASIQSRVVQNHINPVDGKKCFKITTRRKPMTGNTLRKCL